MQLLPKEVHGTTLLLYFLLSLFLISAVKSAIGFSLDDIKSQIYLKKKNYYYSEYSQKY